MNQTKQNCGTTNLTLCLTAEQAEQLQGLCQVHSQSPEEVAMELLEYALNDFNPLPVTESKANANDD